MSDLLERRHVPRHEPQSLSAMVADRVPDCWQDVIVRTYLPQMIDKQAP